MIDKPTLRDRFRDAAYDCVYGHGAIDIELDQFMNDVIMALEDTGSPAHMRVARELRGTDTAAES